MDILLTSNEVLLTAGYVIDPFEVGGQSGMRFEDDTTLGFIFAYVDAETLARQWKGDVDRASRASAFALRKAGQKAWNVYGVFLAGGTTTDSTLVTLSMIEEDLTGMRKVARAGLRDSSAVREALLSLLPIQSAPILEAVNMPAEIRLRASEVPEHVLDAFLAMADVNVVLQVLEEDQ